MEVIEKTDNEVTTFFIGSENSSKVERSGRIKEKNNYSIKELENYNGKAKTFFNDSINEQKEDGKISNSELDNLVLLFQKTGSDKVFSQILGQVLIRTALQKKKKKYVKESWLPFAEEEDYEQTLSLALFMAIDKYTPKEGHFINFCYRYCDGRMSDLNRRSYNGGRSFGNTRTRDVTSHDILAPRTDAMYVNDVDDYDAISDLNVENQVMKKDVLQIISETINQTEATIITLNVINGVPMREVAEIVGLEQAKANYCKNTALERIRKCHPELKSYLQLISAESSDSRIFKKAKNEDD